MILHAVSSSALKSERRMTRWVARRSSMPYLYWDLQSSHTDFLCSEFHKILRWSLSWYMAGVRTSCDQLEPNRSPYGWILYRQDRVFKLHPKWRAKPSVWLSSIIAGNTDCCVGALFGLIHLHCNFNVVLSMLCFVWPPCSNINQSAKTML
jgi:hypothetical protein